MAKKRQPTKLDKFLEIAHEQAERAHDNTTDMPQYRTMSGPHCLSLLEQDEGYCDKPLHRKERGNGKKR